MNYITFLSAIVANGFVEQIDKFNRIEPIQYDAGFYVLPEIVSTISVQRKTALLAAGKINLATLRTQLATYGVSLP